MYDSEAESDRGFGPKLEPFMNEKYTSCSVCGAGKERDGRETALPPHRLPLIFHLFFFLSCSRVHEHGQAESRVQTDREIDREREREKREYIDMGKEMKRGKKRPRGGGVSVDHVLECSHSRAVFLGFIHSVRPCARCACVPVPAPVPAKRASESSERRRKERGRKEERPTERGRSKPANTHTTHRR